MTEHFEDKYLDVLQNIETAIISVYGEHPELSDYNVDKALDGLLRTYQAQVKERSEPNLRLRELEQAVYDEVKTMCEWRLGRIELPVDEETGTEPDSEVEEETESEIDTETDIESETDTETDTEDSDDLPSDILAPKTPDEIIACLKRIRKSIGMWTKKGGRQGYLMYIGGFLD